MNELEQAFKPLPVDNDIIVKASESIRIMIANTVIFDASQSPYISSQEFVDNWINFIRNNLNYRELLKDGIKAKILEPGKQWLAGKIRVRLVFEFMPDEPENNKTPNNSLDDIRRLNL